MKNIYRIPTKISKFHLHFINFIDKNVIFIDEMKSD